MYKQIVVLFVIVDLTLSLGEDDYYEILGVGRTADQKEIRRAFKKLAVMEHPDKHADDPKAHEKFVKLTRAYETLKDSTLRKKYDLHGSEGLDVYNKNGAYNSWTYYRNDFGIYDDHPYVITLDEYDYASRLVRSDQMWIVNFYSTMCSHCHQLAPIWKQIAYEFEGVVRIAAVNCEDEWKLCLEMGVRSYPTLLYYPKNSHRGVAYPGEKTYTAITNFILKNLGIEIRGVDRSTWNILSHGPAATERPMLVFLCAAKRNCLTDVERLKIAAKFKESMDVKLVDCEETAKKCDESYSLETGAIYLPARTKAAWEPILLEDLQNFHTLTEKVLELLPEPLDIDAKGLERIRKRLEKGTDSNANSNFADDSGWLLCFYMGQAVELNIMLKKLSGITKKTRLGKLNCGKYSHVCADFNVNRYPTWGVLKPGGAFELNHGKNTINDIIHFLEGSMKAKNVWALSAAKVSSILKGEAGNESWFLDWYAPWCPPCMKFLREVREASLKFDESVVRFGTIDCTVHSTICQRNNIRSYPTAMLVSRGHSYKFSAQKTAENIILFIEEASNPSVVQLTSKTFNRRLGKRKGKFTWIVKYFAPWCVPCQRLIPEWITVAKSLSAITFLKVASIDCEVESILCRSQEIHSYPTIRMYTSHSEDLKTFYTYTGKRRESTSILMWIGQIFTRKLRELDSFSLRREVLNDKNLWVVDFFVPRCEHCRNLEPQLAIAAQLLQETALFGRLNCESFATECAHAGVTIYPTLLAYDPRHNGKNISAGFPIEGRTAEVMKENILNFSFRFRHDEL